MLYRRLQGPCPQEFSIGIAIGDSPFALRLRNSIRNPVLTRHDVTDVPAVMVADPFMCRDEEQGCWYLFFEVVNHLTGKGEIGLAVSQRCDGLGISENRSGRTVSPVISLRFPLGRHVLHDSRGVARWMRNPLPRRQFS